MKTRNEKLYELLESHQAELLNKIGNIKQLSLHLSSRMEKLESAQKTLQENLLNIETNIEEVMNMLDQDTNTNFGIEYTEFNDDIKKSELN